LQKQKKAYGREENWRSGQTPSATKRVGNENKRSKQCHMKKMRKGVIHEKKTTRVTKPRRTGRKKKQGIVSKQARKRSESGGCARKNQKDADGGEGSNKVHSKWGQTPDPGTATDKGKKSTRGFWALWRNEIRLKRKGKKKQTPGSAKKKGDKPIGGGEPRRELRR